MASVILPAVFSTIALLAAAVSPPPDGAAGNVDKGRVFAADRCGLCHATGPKGASPIRQAPPLRSLNDKYDVDGLAESLAEGISVGDPMMPEHVLKPAEIADLLTYIKSLAPPKR